MAKKYKKNYLDDVIIRIDFEKITDISKIETYLEKLDKTLFPFKTETESFGGTIKIDIEKEKVEQSKNKLPTWEYLDAYKNKKVTITPVFVAIEYLNRSYTNSKELILDCEKIILSFIKDLSISSLNRIGLRYINRFDLDVDVLGSIKWDNFFSKNLVGSIIFGNKLGYPLVRSMDNLHLRKDDHDIVIRYGIWNRDFPSENTRKEFVLDIDIFSKLPLEKIEDVEEIIKQYNQETENIFEEAIGVEIKKLLTKK